MKVYEVLQERREADLYHSTQEYEEILSSGFIEPMENEEDMETGADDKPAISLTRDKNMNIFGPVQFVIDQTKLANTHKIRPIDAVFTRWADGEDELERRSESEERVYKPIPMSYIKALRVVEPEYVDIEELADLAAKHNLPLLGPDDNPITEKLNQTLFSTTEMSETATIGAKLNEGLPAIISAFAVAGGLLLGGWVAYQDHTLSKKWIEAYNELEQQDPAKAKLLKQLVTQYKSTNWKKATIRSMTKDRIERIITDFKNEELKESATAGATSAGNIATVASVPAAYRKIKKGKNGLPKAPQALNKDGTAKNAVDTDINLMGSIIKR